MPAPGQGTDGTEEQCLRVAADGDSGTSRATRTVISKSLPRAYCDTSSSEPVPACAAASAHIETLAPAPTGPTP